MKRWLLTIAAGLFRWPDLSGNAARTFRFHLAYGMLDGAAGGILLNAPIVAIKAFQAANWHLPLREFFSGVGMITALYLGSWMATRPKMPFVFIPGVLAGMSCLTMATATGSALWFLALLGVGAMFEIVTRPAIAAVLRTNYPVEHRGHAAGEVRKWSSLSFVVSSLASALILQLAAGQAKAATGLASLIAPWSPHRTAQVLMVLAGLVSLAALACFCRIRIDEDLHHRHQDLKPDVGNTFRHAIAVVVRDRRYRRYLFGCLADGFFQMLYFPLIWAFLSRDLGFGYLSCSALMHAVPALAAFLATGALGHLIDRSSPWISWAWIRFAWGLDALILAATPYGATVFAPAIFLLPLLGRVVRGSVQGGWWIMWWQIGVTHFAPPGEDTSRYMGIMVFLNGAIRLLASAAGMLLAGMAVSPRTLLIVGGSGVILSGFYSLYQAARERRQHQPETITAFERQFIN
jgi:hypothetical protein